MSVTCAEQGAVLANIQALSILFQLCLNKYLGEQIHEIYYSFILARKNLSQCNDQCEVVWLGWLAHHLAIKARPKL